MCLLAVLALLGEEQAIRQEPVGSFIKGTQFRINRHQVTFDLLLVLLGQRIMAGIFLCTVQRHMSGERHRGIMGQGAQLCACFYKGRLMKVKAIILDVSSAAPTPCHT